MAEKHARPVLRRARELAARLKSVITCENLHTLCRPSPGKESYNPPLMEVVSLWDLGINAGSGVSYGWVTDSEASLAAEIAPALLDAERLSLREVSTDALMIELKSRHDLFFCVACPSTPEDYQWRRSLKGPARSLLGFIAMHFDAVKFEFGLSAGAMDLGRLLNDDSVQRDDEDGPASLGR